MYLTPLLAESNLKSKSQQGFTLIEILVVVVIIGVMLTAVVSLRGSGQEHRYLQGEAERIRHLITVAQQKAIQTGLPARLLFSDNGYEFEFWQLNEASASEDESEALPPAGQWQKVDTGNLKRYRPERSMNYRVSLISNKNKKNEKGKKGILIYPDGSITAVEIQLFLDDWQQFIKMATDGFSPLSIELLERKKRN